MGTWVNTKSFAERTEQLAYETEKHLHNREVWFGAGITEDSLTPYTVISGNGAYGTEVLLLDTTDTPVISGKKYYDPHKIEIASVDTATPYLVRLIWGSGTVGDAETAKQYSTFPVTPSGVGSNVSGAPVPVIIRRLESGGAKLWAKTKNATNLAEIDIYLGIHEYDR